MSFPSYCITPIFPVPLFQSYLPRALTIDEISLIDTLEKEANIGNSVSVNRYVLELPGLSGIRDFIEKQIAIWFDKIEGCSTVTPYITQSWTNYVGKEQYHHEHSHPNSYLSGVFYIAGDDNDHINFTDGKFHQLALNADEGKSTEFNRRAIAIPAVSGKLVMFRSDLSHFVKVRQDSFGTRISLAFNVFIRGTMGDETQLTKLVLG